MAYLNPITRHCATCGKVATEQLVNWVNAPLGYYCVRCSKHALAKQQASEDAHPVQTYTLQAYDLAAPHVNVYPRLNDDKD